MPRDSLSREGGLKCRADRILADVVVIQGFPGLVVLGVELKPAPFAARGRLPAEGPGHDVAAAVRWRQRIERLELLGFCRCKSGQNAAPMVVDGVTRRKLGRNSSRVTSGSGSVEMAFQNLRHRKPRQENGQLQGATKKYRRGIQTDGRKSA